MSLEYVSDDAGEVGRRTKEERDADRERRRRGREERRKDKGRGGSNVGMIALAPARAAFLVLVNLNTFKLADKLALGWKMDKSKIEKFWQKFSGSNKALKKAIEKGSHSSLGSAAAAAIATATPILIALAKLLKELKIPAEDVDDGIEDGLDEIETNPDFEKGNTSEFLPKDQTGVVPGGTKPKTDDTPEPEKKNTGLLVAGALALILLLK